MVEPSRQTSRSRRSDATLNRQRILDAAREAFADTGAETSMAEVVRRSGLGSATVYRNFATRRVLLEAVLMDEVEEICASAATVEGETAGARLESWSRQFFRYVTAKRPVVISLLVLEDTDASNPVFATRDRLLEAARPLVVDAQASNEVRGDLSPDQIIDLVMAIAKITSDLQDRQALLEVALAGLRPGD